MNEVVLIRNAFLYQHEMHPDRVNDEETKYYKKVKLEVNHICRQAIDETNLFHKKYPNRDRIIANVYDKGKIKGSKDVILIT
ncbi:MAG: hypothetical protein EBU88_19190 [Acidobacteria bacterium]|nr:hypothetical protein [Acidobacteriota bacterium]